MDRGISGYRADVDGLRAVAVIAVVLFHADLPVFTGGFVGVDVFFVISGYLITRIILADMERGAFSVIGFYDRRVRRIFPALFAMMFVVLLAGAWVLLPTEFKALGDSVISTTLFGSNFYFWKANDVGYFDLSAALSPLLHTWSLAVEEQFYVVYPLALAALVKSFPRRAVSTLTLVALASLAISVWATRSHEIAAFYLAPSRAWELLAGALLALNAVPRIGSGVVREAAAVAGLGMIVASALVFTDATPFPGTAALVPVVGTVLVIHSGTSGRTVVERGLSLPPIVFIGLISYSLYLWHWPILALLKEYFAVLHLSPVATGWALAASFVVAWLSWRFIERPFRRRGTVTRRDVNIGAVSAAGIAMVAGAGIALSGGMPGRLNAATAEVLAAKGDVDRQAQSCLGRAPEDGRLCQIGSSGADGPNFMLWGDSHAATFVPSLDGLADDVGAAGVIAGASACMPSLGVVDPNSSFDCAAYNASVLDFLGTAEDLETVVLAARWAIYAEGERNPHEPGEPILIAEPGVRPGDSVSRKAVFEGGLERLLVELRLLGKRVVIVGPVPEVGRNVPKAMAMQLRTGLERPINPPYRQFLARQSHVLPVLNAAAEAYQTEIIFPHTALCDDDLCEVARDGLPLYADDDHLTATAASALKGLFTPVFVDAPSR